MSLYNTDVYHSKSMVSTLNHSVRRMKESNDEKIPSLVCGDRYNVSVMSSCCCSCVYEAEW